MRNEKFLNDMIKQFNVHESDKQLQHNYAVGYFELLRNMHVENLLEIGIDKGASLRSWSKIFPEAKIYGIDINPNSMIFEPNSNIRTDIVNQASPADLIRWAYERQTKFDVIVDDGSHIFEHSKISFEFLFPYLAEGGIYIVEDINSEYAELLHANNAPQQQVEEWKNYLLSLSVDNYNVEYRFIDCHYGNSKHTASNLLAITRVK